MAKADSPEECCCRILRVSSGYPARTPAVPPTPPATNSLPQLLATNSRHKSILLITNTAPAWWNIFFEKRDLVLLLLYSSNDGLISVYEEYEIFCILDFLLLFLCSKFSDFTHKKILIFLFFLMCEDWIDGEFWFVKKCLFSPRGEETAGASELTLVFLKESLNFKPQIPYVFGSDQLLMSETSQLIF